MDKAPALIGRIEQPVIVRRPGERSSPVLVASPHSGRSYPPDLLQQTATPLDVLRRSEDAYVDLLIEGVVDHGMTSIVAAFPRVFVDPNRSHKEFDPVLFDDLDTASISKTLHVDAGLGVIPRISADGRNLYSHPMSVKEGRKRLADYYRPYHGAIDVEMKSTRDVFGRAILIDVHSMPSIAAGGMDIVLGDRHGTSCDGEMVDRLESLFQSEGLNVIRNKPYAGGYTTGFYGRPASGYHAVQIEINRGLYLDEDRVTRSETFDAIRTVIRGVLAKLSASMSDA